MALLGQRGSEARGAGKVFLLFCVVALAGCMVFDSFRTREVAFGFSHRLHIEDEGLECMDCHRKADSADDPGMPTRRQCMLCHEDLDEEKPPEMRIDSLFLEGELVTAATYALDEETIFSHLAHVEGAYDCATCHAGIEANEHVSLLEPLSMDDCTSCHARDQVVNECATCHHEIREDWQPDDHYHNWTKMHGQAVRSGSEALVDRCDLCHRESTCNACHMEVAPDNHTNYWRERGHSITASLDRMSCAACHRSDSCNRCHEVAIPLSHGGMWGSPRSNHCLGCHFPLESNGCVTCHKATPSHLNGAPLPPDHSPGLNCRQCHDGVAAPLPHVDKGDECILCHR